MNQKGKIALHYITSLFIPHTTWQKAGWNPFTLMGRGMEFSALMGRGMESSAVMRKGMENGWEKLGVCSKGIEWNITFNCRYL